MNKFENYLYNRLPAIYRNEDKEEVLKDFLSILENGFNSQVDEIRELLDLIDVDRCPDEFIPYLCNTLGVVYEPTIPIKYQRRFLKNVIMLNKRKGTESAIKYLARELGGTDAEITVVDDKIEVFIMMKESDPSNPPLETTVERRKIENYVKYYIPVMLKLAVFLYYGTKPTNIIINEKVYTFVVPYRICNRFRTADIQGGWIGTPLILWENFRTFQLDYRICNMFLCADVPIGELEEYQSII